jgi:hypothetical protein
MELIFGNPDGRRYVITDFGEKVIAGGVPGQRGRGTPAEQEHLVVDDFGDRHEVRRCPCCARWVDVSLYAVRKGKQGYRAVGYCRSCSSQKSAERVAENREEMNAYRRDRYQILKQDPEWVRRKQQVDLEAREKRRERDLEGERQKEAMRSRRYRLRVRVDPARGREARENQRIDRRLRRAVDLVPRVEKIEGENSGSVPSEPLAGYVERWLVEKKVWDPIERRSIEYPSTMEPFWTFGSAAAYLTMPERRLYGLLVRESPTIHVDTVDRVCTKGFGDPSLLHVLYPQLFEFPDPKPRRWEAAQLVWEEYLEAASPEVMRKALVAVGVRFEGRDPREVFLSRGRVSLGVVERIRAIVEGRAYH